MTPAEELTLADERIAVLIAKARPHEPWTRRVIDHHGMCDGCAEELDLVAAYDDPNGEHEPWLCETCAADADLDTTMRGVAKPLAAWLRVVSERVGTPGHRDWHSNEAAALTLAREVIRATGGAP